MKSDVKQIIEKEIAELIADQEDLFLVNCKIDAKNNIMIFLDGDKGISIGQCTKVNRSLYKFIEENELFTNNDFSLEVSSAGVEEPLLLLRQYLKNIGREVEVLLKDGAKHIGTLKNATETNIIVEIVTGKGKKAEMKQEEFVIENIKSVIVQIKF